MLFRRSSTVSIGSLQLFILAFYTWRVYAEAGSVLSNKAFQNFDSKCLPTETISGLACKKFISALGTVDFELTIFCRTIAGPDDPAPKANESNCRYASTFHPQIRTATEAHDCKRGEYVSGIRGTFEGGYRALSLRCCKVTNTLQDGEQHCQTVGPESVATVAATGMRDPAQPRSGCPRNVMSSFSIASGKLTAKFCALQFSGAKYEAFCNSDPPRRVSLEKGNFINAAETEGNSIDPSSENDRHAGNAGFDNLVRVQPGEETEYGQSFQIECPYNEAMSYFQWRSLNGIDGYDLLYRFTCKAVTNGSQEAIRRRVTRFFRPNNTDPISCYDNETLCGFYGIYNSTRRHKRRYAVACCDGSNWYAATSSPEEAVSVEKEGDNKTAVIASTGAGASDGDKTIQSVVITITDQQTTITAIFQSYQYDTTPRFQQNATLYEYKSLKAYV